MADLTIANAATLTGAGTASGDLFPLLDVSASAGSQGSKITRDELRISMGITGGGTLATAGYTLTLPATGTAALLGTANVFTAAQTINAGLTVSSAPLGISTNGSVSAPALAGTGTIFTGGSATTTKPYWLIEPTGTTSTNWSVSGTLLGINAPSGFTGHLQSWQVNGVIKGYINATELRLDTTSLTPNYLFIGSATGTVGFASSTLIEPTANGTLKLSNYARTDFNRLMFGGSTSSFPALKRSTTTLQCRLADDSAYAQFDALGYSVGGAAGASGTVTAASTVTVVNGIITVIA